MVPSEYQYSFSPRIPSPHPELSPPQDTRLRSWSNSSSSNHTTKSSIVPSIELGLETQGSSQYFTPAGSTRSWSSLQPPLLQGNSNQISGGGSGLGTVTTDLPNIFTPTRESQAPNYSIQKRYTEDWVLQRGFQTHRRSDSSWYSEHSDNSSFEENANIGTHRRYPSDTKTITPADFQSGKFLLVPRAELSSDADTGTSEGAWKTAPQSFTENKTGGSSPIPMLASQWSSSPPNIMEDRLAMDVRVKPDHPNSDLSVFGVVENGPSTKMIRTPSPPSSTEATTSQNPMPNGISASLLSHTPQLSRSGTPNIKSKKRKAKTVVKVPTYSPWGLPLDQGGRPMPLTSLEMEERSRQWEAKGYTLEFLSGQGGHSKDIFPAETREKVKDVVVNIRDPSEWQEYCNKLREEKLRALGVILPDDTPAAMPATTTTTTNARGQTPLSHQSPAPFQVNPYSPPHPTQSAMSNGIGHNGSQGINYHGHHYSPSMAQASIHGPLAHMSPIPAPANHHLAYHMPRQSMSMNATPINHDWDMYSSNIYTPSPPQNQPTPPMINGSGVWSPAPPGPFGARNASPMGGMGHPSHPSHSTSMFGPQFIVEENQDYMIPNEYVDTRAPYYSHNQLSFVGSMDRFQQQQMRRGSPLAQSGHLLEDVQEQMGLDMMAIDAPVPGRRHNLSISLEKDMEGMENYQKEIETHIGHHHLSNGDGFNTNPVSPAPEAMYPQQPDMPGIENDVHNGPELLSNPEDDIPDVETERRQNRQAARERTQSIGINGSQYDINPLPMSGSQYMPQSYQPHSRDTSLSQLHQYDDPIENSALSMLMGPRLSGRVGMLDELLSEGGRTNPSDINTNPSEPSSPRPKYTSHMHNLSNNSNAWMSDTSKAPGSTTSSKKFNAQAPEFKFKSGTTFKYSPQSKPFIPSGSVNSSPIGSTTHSRNTSQDPIGFGSIGKGKLNVSATPFRPRLFSNGSASSAFAKGNQFSPDAPVFKPKSTEPIPTSTNKSSLPPIFSPTKEIDEPVLDKQTSRSASRASVHKETLVDVDEDDAREGNVSGGGGKRAKHGPTPSLVKDTEVPALESLRPSEDIETSDANAADSQDATPTEETFAESSVSSDEVEDVPKELPIHEEPFVMIEEGEATSFTMVSANIPTVSSKGEGETPLDVLDQELSAVDEAEAAVVAVPTERASTPYIEVLGEPTPQAAAAAPDFNFNFSQAAEPATPMEAKFSGMGESRYAHAPSPPPAHPAPSPPIISDMLPLPTETASYASNADSYRSNPFVDPVKPMPTDSELDEVIQELSKDDPIYVVQDNEVSESGASEQSMDEEQPAQEEVADEDVITRRRDISKRPAIPVFHDLTPISQLQDPFEQGERSAAPSPSPSRSEFQHTAATFSSDDATYGHAQTTGEVVYQPPTQEDIGHGQAESDWDDMISQDDTKLRPQSRLFFDAHVEEFVGDLLSSRLDPLNKSLSAIHDVLKKNHSLTLGRRGSVATSAPHSDADDEEDETQPPRSPRKDKKSEKIKSAVVEALVMHNWNAPTEDKLAEIYSAIAKVSRAFQDSHWNDDLAETKSSILQAVAKAARADEIDLTKLEILAAIKRTAKSTDMEDLKTSFARSVSKMAQVEDIASIRESMEEVAQTSDIVGMKLELRDALINTAQKSDLEDIRNSILSQATHKDDLEHLQNITIESFSKVVKTNDIVELKNTLSEIIRTIHTTDIRGDVQQLSRDNDAVKETLTQVYELTRDNAVDANSHQQAQENYVKESYNIISQSLETIHDSVSDVHQLIQQRSQKEDMRRSLQEGDQKQNFADIKTYIGEVNKNVVEVVGRVPNVEDIRLVVGKISESQPRLADIKDIFEEVVAGQPTLGQVRSAVEDVVNKQPTIEELKSIVEGATSKQPTIEELKSVVEEVAKTQPTIEDLKFVVEEAAKNQPTTDDLRCVVEEVGNKQAVDDLRVAVEEAFNRQPTIGDLKLVVEEVANNQPSLCDVKAVMEEVTDGLPKMDALRFMMEELLSKHQTVAVTRATEQANTEEIQLRMASLEKMLGEADRRAEAESQARREAHEKTLELESRLRIAEEEAARYRGEAEESDRRLRANDEKRSAALTQSQMRVALLEGAHSALQKTVGEMSARNAQLEGTIGEAKSVSERNKQEANRVEEENKGLRRVIDSLKTEMQESIRVREGFRGKFDKLQEDMRTAANNIGQQEGKWRKTQEEQRARIEVLEARVAAEVTVKEGLESEVRRLEVEQKEAIKLKVEYEQLKRSNGKLEEVVDKLMGEKAEHSQRAAALAHEVESARDSAHGEVARVRESLQRDVDAANTTVNTVRASLESEVELLQHAVKDALSEKEQFKLRLDQAVNSERVALDELEKTKTALSQGSTESKSAALQEQRQKYEKQVLELRQQFEDTRSQNDRALRIATEDGEREAFYLKQRLGISQSEVQHLREQSKDLREQTKDLREHISLLKDQLKIATTAAQAAAQAAANSRAPQAVYEERALRESVNVLQEQLQQREARIEELEQQLSGFDKADIKRKDEQITWLRELLDVRVDELEEIVHALSMPHFDRESVRDTALRLRANLQMEQREKEMAMTSARGPIAPVASLASRLPSVASSAASSAAGWWNSKNKGPSSVAQSSSSRPGSAAGFLGNIIAPTPLATSARMGSRLARGVSSETGSNSSHTTITSRYREEQALSYRTDRGGSRRVHPHLFQEGLYGAGAGAGANDSVMSADFYEEEDNATEMGADDGDMLYRQGSNRH